MQDANYVIGYAEGRLDYVLRMWDSLTDNEKRDAIAELHAKLHYVPVFVNETE